MGRSFLSVRMGVNEIAGRWKRASHAMREGDSDPAESIVTFIKQFSSEAFYAFDDPFEAALFSAVISMVREQERAATGPRGEPAGRSRETMSGSPDERQSGRPPDRV